MEPLYTEHLQPHQKPTQTFFNVLKPVANFYGRDDEIKQIHEKLQTNCQALAICGVGGIGKSEIARKYATTYQDVYDNNVIWINCENLRSLYESFNSLSSKLKIPQTSSEYIVETIYQYFQDYKVLFVFDSVENCNYIDNYLSKYFFDANKGLRILITSRNNDWEIKDEGLFEVFTLNQFAPTESLDFLKKTMDIELKDASCEYELNILAEKLQHSPLALCLAASYIKQCTATSKLDISAYISNYERELENFDWKSDDYSDQCSETILITLQMILTQIKQDPTFGKEALQILQVMAYLAPDDICMDSIIAKIVENEILLQPSVQILQKFSLINVEKSSNIANINRIVQLFIRSNLEKSGNEERILRNALRIIVKKKFIYTNHFVTVWNFAIKYCFLFHEFYTETVKLLFGHKLIYAFAKIGYADAINHMLRHISTKNYGVSVNGLLNSVDDYFTKTPLHLAASEGHTNVVKLLLNKYNARKDIEEKRGGLPLIRAIEKGHASTVEILSDSSNRDLCILFAKIYKSMRDHNLGQIKYLWNEKCTAQNFEELNLTPVVCAAYLGDLDMIQFLIRKGLNCNETSHNKNTPLLSACYKGNLDIVKYFIQIGSHINSSNRFEDTPMLCASNQGHLDIIKYFLDNGLADLNEKNSHYKTPLMFACSSGKLEVVKYFVSKGCCVKQPDKYGLTPLLYASKSGHLDIVKYLLSVGSSVTETASAGYTSLMFASKYAHLDIVKFLISEGSDPSYTNRLGHTALSLAITFHNDVISSYLKEVDRNESETEECFYVV